MELLVLGIGNELRSDDGVGVRVVRSLARSWGEGVAGGDGVRWLEGGTRGLALLEPIERCSALIAVDAAELGASPGAVRVLEGEELDRFAESGGAAASAHEFALGALCAAARLRNGWPGRRALVAVQPGSTDWGAAFSPAVERAAAIASREVRRLIAAWGVQ